MVSYIDSQPLNLIKNQRRGQKIDIKFLKEIVYLNKDIILFIRVFLFEYLVIYQ